jgi:hypothetical protein
MTKKVGRTRKRDQATKQRTLWVTDDGWNNLGHFAENLGISKSELVERFVRGDGEVLEAIKKKVS